MISLYEEYVMERENLSSIKIDGAFILYKFVDDKCLLADIFVSQRRRKGTACFGMVATLFDMCSERNINEVVCQVDTLANGHVLSEYIIKRYGFEMFDSDNRFKWFKKSVIDWQKDFNKFGRFGLKLKEATKKKLGV